MSKFISTNNLDKLSKAIDNRAKELIEEEKARAIADAQELQTEINVTKEMFGGKSIKYVTQAEYDNLSEAEKNNPKVTYFITDAEDMSHEHENKEFLDNLAARNIVIGNKSQVFDGVNDLQYSISDIGAAPANHNHNDKYYTETEIDGKIEDINETINTKEAALQAAINGKANSNHNHNDVYYTETEIDGMVEDINETINTKEAALQASINGKAPSSHTHDDKYYTETEVDNKLAGKANSSHGNHVPATQTANNATFLRNDNTWATVTPANIGAAASSHNHDDRYYTESEVNGKIEDINETINTKEASLNSAIATAKSGAISESKSYTDTAIANLVDSAPDAMNTLNELAKAISDHQDEYEAYVNTVSTNIANAKAEAIAEAVKKDTALHTTISAEIDADVKVEKERAMEAEADLQAAIDGKAANGHVHDDRYYTETEINTKISNLQAEIDADVKVEKERAMEAEADLQAAIDGKAASGHNHDDRYYTESEINTKLAGKSDTGHSHNDVYYTETEIDGMVEDINETINTKEAALQASINGKANSSHGTHVPTPQTANNATFLRNDNSWQKVTPANIGAAPASHNHNDVYYTESEINTKLAGKSDTGHTHDDKYYTETEIDGMVEDINETINTKEAALQASINGKAANGHTHDDRYYTETEVDNKLAGKANTSHGNHVPATQTANIATFLRNDNTWATVTPGNIGAAPASHNHNDVYYTETEVNGLIEDVNETINTKEAALQSSINGKANSSHGNHVPATQTANNATFLRNDNTWATVTPANIGAAASSHNHDDRYYTESEMNTKLAGKSDTGHSHNDVYYTETEIDGMVEDINETISTKEAALQASINGKANSSHGTHVPTPQTANNATFLRNDNSWQKVTPANIGAAPASHGTHVPTPQTVNNATFLRNDNSWQKVTPANIGAAASSHTHDDRYYTETEINGKIEDINETISTNVTTLNSAIATAKSGAISESKSYTDTAISKLVDSAPEAMNTINELAKAINDHQDEYEAYVNTVSTNIATAKSEAIAEAAKKDTALHTTISAEIDADVKVEKERAMEAENALQAAINGKANSSHGTHVTWATNAPKANGTAAVGTVARVAREDHVHPLQTSVSGNAGTATTLQNARNITIGNKTNSFNGSANISYSISDIGAAPASHTHDDRYYTETEINGKIEDINETINTKEAALQASINGKAPSSHNHTSVNKTMITTTLYNASSGILVDFNVNEKSGAMVILKLYGNSYSTNPPIEAIYQFYDYAGGDMSNGTGSAISGPSITLKVFRVGGKLKAWFQQPNDYCTFKLEVAYGNNASTPNVTLSNAVAPTTNITQTVTITPDRVYSKKYKPTPADIGASASSHNHDDRYYTESEMNTKLAGKSNTGHNHNDVYYTETEVNGLIEDVNETINTKEAALQASINGKAPSSHTHDDRYYTETEVDNKLAGKANSSHGNHVPATQTASNKVFLRNDNTWATVTPANIGAAASSHTHDDRYYTETEVNGLIEDVNETINTKEAALQASINGKANSSHGNHVPTPQTVNNATFLRNDNSWQKVTPANIGAAPASHNHNDVYYTESEMNTKLAGKSDTGHSHDDRYYTETEINGKIEDINETINTKEAALQASINGKANSSHTHNVINPQDTRAVNTSPKDVPNGLSAHLKSNGTDGLSDGGTYHTTLMIKGWNDKSGGPWGQLSVTQNNNLYFRSSVADNDTSWNAWKKVSLDGHTHDNRYYTETEVDNKLAGKANSSHGNHVPATQTASNKVFLRNDNTWQTITPANIGAAAASHGTHVPTPQTANNAKFLRNDNTWQTVTPANIGAEPRDNTVATVSVSNGKLTLTTAKRQKCTNLVSGTEIVFPTVTTFTEIHLYFSATTNMNLTFPDCKWRVDPNIESGKSYEIVATYNTMEWLVNVIVYS